MNIYYAYFSYFPEWMHIVYRRDDFQVTGYSVEIRSKLDGKN